MGVEEKVSQKTIEEWREHWQDEFDAAFLYRVLAGIESDQKKKDFYMRFAEVEDRHVVLWKEILEKNGAKVPDVGKPTGRARLLAWVAKRFSPDLLLNLLLREEGQEVRGYLAMHRDTEHVEAKATALTLAKESAEHAEELGKVAGSEGEPWHRTETGGFMRNVIYGFNDGLTANFGLIAGVLAATATGQQHAAVLIAGIAGTVADALSMGSSGFLAAKSEQEVYDHEIAMEKHEIELMPELEQEELALIYESKGLDRESAVSAAADVMSSPERALEEKVREELKIGEAHATPFREGWVTGLATAIGAFIPVFPFLVFTGVTAIVVSFAISMLSHFGVGAARSMFTGRGIFRSGFDMFVVGFGVAGIGYLIGNLIEGIT